MIGLNHLYIFLLAVVSSLVLVPMLRSWAIERQMYDIPDQRKVHVNPTPRLGGVAIFLSVLLALLVFGDITREIRGILYGALVLFLTGLIDDLSGLSPKKKFFGQISACMVTMFVGDLYITRLGDLFGLGDIVLPVWLAVPFTVFAVVGVINALNLLDGLDGLAGGVSAIALVAFVLLGLQSGHTGTISLCIALLGGVLGFLRFNAHPATIFMGDSGSLTVGFLLGFIAVMITQQPAAGVQPVVPLVILGLPIFDTLRVMGKRIIRGASPFAADRTHIHHKFLDLGLNHPIAVLAIYGLTLFWVTVALVFRQGAAHLLLAAYLVSMGGFYLALRHLVRYKETLVFARAFLLAEIFSAAEISAVGSACDDVQESESAVLSRSEQRQAA